MTIKVYCAICDEDVEVNDNIDDCPACGEPCGCDDEFNDDSMDGDFDSAMASAGFGTDEDYGFFGGDEDWYGADW